MREKPVKRICVISQGYPTQKQPWFPFVDQLLCAMTEQGVHCTVISPQSVSRNALRSGHNRPVFWQREYKGHTIDIYQPRYVSLSNLRVGKYHLSDMAFERQVLRCFCGLKQEFDVIYGHFWVCGLIAAKLSERYGIPAFMACGESKIPFDALRRNLAYKENLRGIVCVSTKSRDESVQLGLCQENKTVVCPNAIDTTRFYPMDRAACRRKLNIPQDVFVAAFVGAFSHRKGSMRLSEALSKTEDIYSVFIGSGPEVPMCARRLFVGSLPHDKIAEYLCAADVFVLPTLNEGCCNAIVEAMACGLPIISSALPFNDDILNDQCAIRIDPMQTEQIRYALCTLRDDAQLRNKMGEASLQMAAHLTIEERAKKIIAFMRQRT